MSCDKWIIDKSWSIFGPRKYKCSRQATTIDLNGRNLCQKHYNQWINKINKHKQKLKQDVHT